MNAIETNRSTLAWARIGASLPKPRAILMISAHWLTRGVAVAATPNPRTIHDFGAFPKALFAQQYPAPGDPALASRVAELLAPWSVKLDQNWGFDHGTWSVLGKAFPNADIPVVQLSMDLGRDAQYHYDIGQALRPLRDEGILIVGSGNVVHNLSRMDWNAHDRGFDWAQQFHDYVLKALVENTPQAVIDYEQAGRAASLSVPTPDHYWPFLYALGARESDDTLQLTTNYLEYGSLSMLSFVLGQTLQPIESTAAASVPASHALTHPSVTIRTTAGAI